MSWEWGAWGALRDTVEEVSKGASRLAMVAEKGEARRLCGCAAG